MKIIAIFAFLVGLAAARLLFPQLSIVYMLMFAAGVLFLGHVVGVYNLLPKSKLGVGAAVIIAAVLLVFPIYSAGALGDLGLGGAPAQFVVPGQQVTTTVTTTTAAGCQVSNELLGKSSTVDILTYDRESASLSAISGVTWSLFQDGTLKSTTTSGTATATVGDVITLYNKTETHTTETAYLVEPVKDFCVNSERPTIQANAYDIADLTEMDITGYDDTGSTALTAGDTNDYKLTVGASSTENVYIKLKVNTADKAFKFSGWGVAYNNLTSVKPISDDNGGTYKQIATPLFLNDIAINLRGTYIHTNHTYTTDYIPFERTAPILMHEWDSFKTKFEVKATATNPADVNPNSYDRLSTPNLIPVFIAFCALDEGYYPDGLGVFHESMFTPDESENNIGLQENLTAPKGGDHCMLLEIE